MAGTTVATRPVFTRPSGGSWHQGIIQQNNGVDDAETLRRGTLSQPLNSAGLVIHGSASALVKSANAVYCLLSVAGAAQTFAKLAAADMAALAGTVTNAKWGAWFFLWDGTTQTNSFVGGALAALTDVGVPTVPDGSVCIGAVLINPTGTGDFVGGTTALDDGTVVPNAVYLDFYGGANLSPTNVASALVAAKIGDMSGTAITA